MTRCILALSVSILVVGSIRAIEQPLRQSVDVAALIPNMAGRVVSVTGPVDPEALGTTLMHEHIFVDLNEPREDAEQWRWTDRGGNLAATAVGLYHRPLTMDFVDLVRLGHPNRDNRLLADERTAVSELMEFKRRGGTTIVETTSIGLRRDPLALRRVARATGLNIVMGASWYRKTYHPPDMNDRSVESLTGEIVRDVAFGVGDTGIRAGIIGEVGIVAGYAPQEPEPVRHSGNPLTANEIKVIKASARASRLTGAPVSLHIYREQPQVLDLLQREGVDLSRVIVGHSDPLVADIPFMKRLLERACTSSSTCSDESDTRSTAGTFRRWVTPTSAMACWS